MRRFIDISVDVGPDLIVWPGDPSIDVRPVSRISRGDSANVSELRLGSHTGTHIDAPFHFIEGGATADEVPLEVLVGDAVVADLTRAEGPVGPHELEALGLRSDVSRLLLKTSNSAIWDRRPAAFPSRYVSLSAEGARWIVEHGIRLMGIDFLSIEAMGSPGHPTHRTLLAAGVVIVEGLDLSAVEPGRYELMCLPLKLAGGDGAPARAVLVDGRA